MADLMSASSGMKRLNSHSYSYWQIYIEPYLQGQDLCVVIASTKTTTTENAEALWKWCIKAGKTMFVLKMMIDEDLVEHI